MKRFHTIFAVLLLLNFTPVASADDFTLDAPPLVTSSQSVSASSSKGGFFSRLFNKKKKQSKTKEPVFEDENKGYYGSIPNVNSEFSYKNKKTNQVKKDDDEPAGYNFDDFQKSNIDDPLFLDVILNKEKPSEYVNNMLIVMKFLEKFRPVVQNHEPVQKFNANVNLLDLHAKRIEKLYCEKPEGLSPSYWCLLDLAYKAKVLGNLKYDANYYAKFSPVKGTQYDPLNLMQEDEKFLIDLDKTIFTIRQLNN